jgi:hypothetical protein
MELRDLGPDGQTALDQALGYLNFSTGTEDASFLANLSLLQGRIAPCEAFGCQTSDETSSGASLAPYQRCPAIARSTATCSSISRTLACSVRTFSAASAKPSCVTRTCGTLLNAWSDRWCGS